MAESKTEVWSITIPRNQDTQDPFHVLAAATKQAQGEAALKEVQLDNGISQDDANFYYKTADGFVDLIIWASDEDLLEEVIEILEGRYGHEEFEVEEHARGEA